MEAITDATVTRAARAAVVTARVAVQMSTVAAVATGCWFLSRALPPLGIAGGALFLAIAAVARRRFDVACGIVLLLAYTSTGLLLLLSASLPAASLWLAALAGLVVGGCSWTRWTAPIAWRWPLMLWLVGVAISWPIVAAREADFSEVVRGDGVGLVVIAALTTLGSGLWLEAALSWDVAAIERRVARPLLASVLIAAAAVFYQVFVDITWLSGEPWIQLRRATGLMGDANPMAVAAAVWAPLAPFVWRTRGGLVAGVAATVVLWSAAWLTGARSVILLVGAGLVGLAAGAVASRSSRRRALIVVAGATTASAVVLLVLARQPAAGPIGRLAETLPLDRPMELAYEVLWRRDGYGLAAARAIREHPWSGVGHGAFTYVSPYYYRLEGGPLVPPDNAQNLWRHSLAERGVFAFVAVMALTFATLRLLVRTAANVPVAYEWALKAMVLGLGLVLVFGLPVQNPALALTAASLLAWLNAATIGAGPPRAVLSPQLVALVWVLAIAGASVDAWNARGELRPPWRAARAGDFFVRGFGDVETGPRAASGRIVRDHGVVSLPVSGSRYELRLWVRGMEARHVRVWQNQRLVMDELLPAGVLIERVLPVTPLPGMLLEFESDAPGIVVAGEFTQ